MEFMDLLKEWLYLRDEDKREIQGPDGIEPRGLTYSERDRMFELEQEINARMRGELPR